MQHLIEFGKKSFPRFILRLLEILCSVESSFRQIKHLFLSFTAAVRMDRYEMRNLKSVVPVVLFDKGIQLLSLGGLLQQIRLIVILQDLSASFMSEPKIMTM